VKLPKAFGSGKVFQCHQPATIGLTYHRCAFFIDRSRISDETIRANDACLAWDKAMDDGHVAVPVRSDVLTDEDAR